MVKIILLNGPPRSGKDTAAEIALSIIPPSKGIFYRFAAPLKDMAHAMIGLPNLPSEYFNNVKDQQTPDFFGLSPREVYIWLSENCVKPRFGFDFWSRIATRKIRGMTNARGDNSVVVISDCGFQEELDTLVSDFGSENIYLLHVIREGTSFASDSRSYINHDREQSRVLNNNGTIKDLKAEMKKILGGIINGE